MGRTVNIEEFPKHMRKRMRKQFRDNEYCPKCKQILCVVKRDKGFYYCSWCNKVFKDGKIIKNKDI